VGREQELAVLHARLNAGAEARRVVLWGAPGQGKTALAREYALRHAAEYPGGLWWVPAQWGPKQGLAWLLHDLLHLAPTSLQEELEPLSQDIFTFTQVARAVLQALESQSEPTLLVLDGLRASDWLEHLPKGHVRVLVTSRAAMPAGKGDAFLHHLRNLQRSEVDALLAKVLPLQLERRHDAARARVLAAWLRGSPLLVSITARFLARTGMSWMTLEKELSRYTRRGAARHVAILDFCIEQFPKKSLPRRMLEGVAVFAPDTKLDTPWAWAAALGGDPFEPGSSRYPEAPEALRLLERSGLLHAWQEDLSHFCWAHSWVLQRVRALASNDTWRRIVPRGLAYASEWAGEVDHGAGTAWEMALLPPHLEAVLQAAEPLTQASRDWVDAADTLADYLHRHGELLKAKTLWQRALRKAEQGLGVDAGLRSRLRAKLAKTHEALGNTAAALRLLKQAVADDALNPKGWAGGKAERLADLALLQYIQGQAAAALVSVDRALVIDREELGSRDHEFPMRLYLRARILQALGRTEEAHALLEEALVLGEKRTLALSPILEALAESRRERGDEKGALTLYERLLDYDFRFLGEHHFETLLHLSEMARTYAEFDRRAQTHAAVERVLRLLDEVQVSSDPRYSDILLSLAESLGMVNARAEAQTLLKRVLDVESARTVPDFGRISRLVLTSLVYPDETTGEGTDVLLERALTLVRRGELQSQEPVRLMAEFLGHVLHSRVPEDVPAIPSTLQAPSPGAGAESLERALRLYRRSKMSDALKAEAFQEALAAAQQGNDPANGARALFLLADLHGRRGAWEQARLNAQQGLEFALRAEVPTLVVEGYRLIGDAALHGSIYEEARMCYAEAIRRYDELGDSRLAARTRTLLVTLLLQLGRHDGLEDHVRWLKVHQVDPRLTAADRQDLKEVLALAHLRLSSPKPGASHLES
jgi:tetratricopeptide (TPR) repeat protein